MAASILVLAPFTPPDYHRILSPSLRIPDDPKVPIQVGLLACQRDPLLRSLNTTIVAASVHHPESSSVKIPGKKSVIAPAIPKDPLLEVILHDTVIFPEGGGQPTDTGIITTTSDGVAWEVFQAKRHGGHAVHYVRVASGNVHVALATFSPGAEVIVSLRKEDSDRRYDHMALHTSQHLLSALLETRLSLPTLSWSLTSYPSPCYIEIPRGMTAEEIAFVQTEANKLVSEGRKVYVEVQELDRSQETAVSVLESGRAVGRGLPDDYTGGVKRVIVIDGVDRNPCCGTHLPSLNNLQLFILPHTDALARSSATTARLYFLSGPRLIAHLSATHKLLTSAAATLSCGAPQVPDRVSQVIEEKKRTTRRLEDVEGELAKAISRSIMDEAKSVTGDTSMFKKHLHRIDDSENVFGFLSAISHASVNEWTPESRPYLIILTSSPLNQTASSVTVAVLFGSEEKKIKQMGDALKATLGVKGGGRGTRWSGKFLGIWKEAKEGAILADIMNTF